MDNSTRTGSSPDVEPLPTGSETQARPRRESHTPAVRTRRGRCYTIDAIRTMEPSAQDEHMPVIQEGVNVQQPLLDESDMGTPTSSTFAASNVHVRRPSAAAAVAGTGNANRRRAHSVGVRMPPSRQFHRAPTDIEAQNTRRPSDTIRSSVSLDITVPEAHDSNIADHNGQLDDDVVGLLDVVDPEVGTVNHLQNVTNGLMFPHIPMLWSRRPHLTLSSSTDEFSVVPQLVDEPKPMEPKQTGLGRLIPGKRRPPMSRFESAPAGIPLADIDDRKGEDDSSSDLVEEVTKEHELDEHMRKVLQRKDKVRRALRGLWAYLKTPMGAITAIYGFLVAFWGAAIVLFLLGWIPTSSKDTKDKWVEITSQVENGLFTITGVGLIPWRVIDTYRMSVIWTMRMRIQRRRAAQGLPPATDADDLPAQKDTAVLSAEEGAKLEHNQQKFAESQTWYRPHETATHRAFPIKLALWNTILMDGNSFFQCILCGTMWGLNRHQRPAWSTGILIPASFLCGIVAGVLIWQGGARTKKTKDVTKKLNDALAVDEKVPETVKHPRRATVTGASGPGALECELQPIAFRKDTLASVSEAHEGHELPQSPLERKHSL